MGSLFTTLLTQPLANGLVVFYKIFGNMGVAIILFSVVLKFVLSPLSDKALKNAKLSQDLRPAISKLKAKYKGDQKKFLAAQQDLFKEKGFNPMAGCLPQILQIIVLYAFLAIFSQVLTPNGGLTENFNKLLYPFLQFDPSEVIHTQFLYLDVTKPDVFRLPGVSFPIPGPILILSAISQFISAKIMMPVLAKEEKIAKGTKTETDDAAIASQQMTILMLPVLTLIFGINFSSGLAIYWLVFSVIQTYQQYKISGWGGLTPTLRKFKLIKTA